MWHPLPFLLDSMVKQVNYTLALTAAQCLRLVCFQSTSTLSALEVLYIMRYINLRLKISHFTTSAQLGVSTRDSVVTYRILWLTQHSHLFLAFIYIAKVCLMPEHFRMFFATAGPGTGTQRPEGMQVKFKGLYYSSYLSSEVLRYDICEGRHGGNSPGVAAP